MKKTVRGGLLFLVLLGLTCSLLNLRGDDTTTGGSSANPDAQPTSNFAGFSDTLIKESLKQNLNQLETSPQALSTQLVDPFIYVKADTTGIENFSAVSETRSIAHHISWDANTIPAWAFYMQAYIRIDYDPNIVEVTGVTPGLFDTWIWARGPHTVIFWTWYIWPMGGTPTNDPTATAFTVNFHAKSAGTTNLAYDITSSGGMHRGWFWVGSGHSSIQVPAEMQLLPLITPPNAPSNLTARTISSSRIDLQWLDNSNNEQGFVLERKTEIYGAYEPIAYISTISPDAGSGIPVWFSNEGLSPDTTYYYRVRAYNEAGPSNYTAEMTALTLLSTPTDLVAQPISISQINLTWHDNSLTEEGFVIERQVDYGPFIPVATVGTNAVNYSDTGLASYTQYKYRIKAVRTGNWSDYSGETTTETYRVTGAYISNLINQYVQDGSIDNQGIAEALQSKLTAAEDSLARGNLTAYRNQLTAFRNEAQAQSGQHITVNTAGLLFQLVGQIQNVQSEIRGAKPTIAPAPYIPEGQVITFMAIITPSTATGNYKWTVSPAGSAKIELVGNPEGTTAVTPTIGVKGLKASDKLDDVGLNFVFTETVKGKAIVTTTAAWKFTVITTSFPTILVDIKTIKSFRAITTIATANAVTITGLAFAISSTVTINTDPIDNVYASQWELGYLQNAITSYVYWRYENPISTTLFRDYVISGYVPILDGPGYGVPMTDTKNSFIANGSQITVNFIDEPGAENITWTPLGLKGELEEVLRFGHYVTWLIARNKVTGEIRYLHWWEWATTYHVTFANRKSTVGQDSGLTLGQAGNKNDGSPIATPNTSPPLAREKSSRITDYTQILK